MPPLYFGEREHGVPPQDQEEVSERFWAALVAIVRRYIAEGWLAEDFPELCPDGRGRCGCDERSLAGSLEGAVPGASWPLLPGRPPSTVAAMEVIEFIHGHVSKPTRMTFHESPKHFDMHAFDRGEAKAALRQEVGELFRRNRLAYELTAEGAVRRTGPPVLREALEAAVFSTGDTQLDGLLEEARRRFASPNPDVRREAVQKLWAAFERLKALHAGRQGEKRASIERLLEEAVADPQEFRSLLSDEANALTKVGNTYGIRHSETYQVSLAEPEYLDYLFHRLFALVRLIMRRTGRGG